MGDASSLLGVELVESQGMWQIVAGCPNEHVAPFDFVRFQGQHVQEQVVVVKAPFGKRNEIPISDRGWIYLERFCSMIKIAMLDEEDTDRTVFSNSEEVLGQIKDGGKRL